MVLERKIAKHLLDIEAVALRPNDYFTWTSELNHRFTVITELQCHILRFVVK